MIYNGMIIILFKTEFPFLEIRSEPLGQHLPKVKGSTQEGPSRSCRVGLNPISIYDVEQRMTPLYCLSSNTGTEYSGKIPFHPPQANKRIQQIAQNISILLQNR